MIEQVLDLHIHSKYSRACSRDLELPKIALACQTRGIDICATGDFTHPAWFNHIKENLEEWQEGIYKLKNSNSVTKFIIGTELACIKKHKDKTRRVHVCVFAPNLFVAEKFNQKLEALGFNLKSDGRPILGLTVKELLEIMLEVDKKMIMIPAHAWTPWFSIFGSKGGYNSLEEAFEELTPHIRAIETGLSSDPLMNWKLSALDNIALVSNSDAHSLAKLGREANVFEFKNEKEITYTEIMRIINTNDKTKFKYTIEFFPEEGKYHFDGCAACKFSASPEETKKLKGVCPKCHKKMIIGVLNRVFELGDRSDKEARDFGKTNQVPYYSLVPLIEIIGGAYGMGVASKKVKSAYDDLTKKMGSEFKILIKADLKEIEKFSSSLIVQGIERVRQGNIEVIPGYDGIFGVVKIYNDASKSIKRQGLLL